MNSIVNWSGVGENVKAGRYRFVIPSDQEICTAEVSITQRKQFHRGQRNICEVEAPAGPRMCDDLVSSGIGTKASRLAKRRDSNSIHKAQDRTSQAVRTGLENYTPESGPSGVGALVSANMFHDGLVKRPHTGTSALRRKLRNDTSGGMDHTPIPQPATHPFLRSL